MISRTGWSRTPGRHQESSCCYVHLCRAPPWWTVCLLFFAIPKLNTTVCAKKEEQGLHGGWYTFRSHGYKTVRDVSYRASWKELTADRKNEGFRLGIVTVGVFFLSTAAHKTRNNSQLPSLQRTRRRYKALNTLKISLLTSFKGMIQKQTKWNNTVTITTHHKEQAYD